MNFLSMLGLVTVCFLLHSPSASAKHKQWHGHGQKWGTTKIVNPPELFDPAPFGFSHIVIGKGKRTAYIAGQSGEDSNGVFDPDFETQVRRTHEHIKIALRAIKAKPKQVTKITTYVVNYSPAQLGIITQYLKDTFGDNLPAQTLVPVPRLALDGMLFEIDAVVVLDK